MKLIVCLLFIASLLVIHVIAKSSKEKASWKLIANSVSTDQKGPSNRFDAAYGTTPDNLFTVIYGGVLEEFVTGSDLWIFNHRTSKWKKVEKVGNQDWPPALKDANGFFCGSMRDFYIIGGKFSDDSVSNQIWRFNLVSKQWKRLNSNANQAQLNLAARYAHFSTCIKSKVYIFGGVLPNGELTNQLLKFSIVSHILSTINPRSNNVISPRSYAPIINIGNYIYVFGGFSKGVNINDLWKFNLSTRKWANIKPSTNEVLPPARSGHNLFKVSAHSEKFVIFGGESTSSLGLNDMWSFDTTTRQWKPFEYHGSVPGGRLGSLMFKRSPNAPNQFLLFGGVSGWTNTKILGDLYQAKLYLSCE